MRRFTLEDQARLRPIIDAGTQHYLQKYTRAFTRTLEIGCGQGQYRLAVNGEYIGIDITADDYKKDLPRTPDVVADAAHLPFVDNHFDIVFFSNIFHYFDRAIETLVEAVRILRPDGHLMIFDYSYKTLERLRRDYALTSPGYSAHPRICADWVNLLNSTNLVNVTLSSKSLSIKNRLARSLSVWAFQPIYFARVDGVEGAIVAIGRKPECQPIYSSIA